MSGGRCSICHSLLDPGGSHHRCEECEQLYHRQCWDEIGGCATYGCKQAAAPRKPAQSYPISGGWGDLKKCPACEESITSSLLICRCGAKFPYADPMTPDEYDRWLKRTEEIRGKRSAFIALFVLSLLGLPAPVTGLIAGIMARRNKDIMAGSDGTYLAMGYGSAAIGATYALVILLLMLGL